MKDASTDSEKRKAAGSDSPSVEPPNTTREEQQGRTESIRSLSSEKLRQVMNCLCARNSLMYSPVSAFQTCRVRRKTARETARHARRLESRERNTTHGKKVRIPVQANKDLRSWHPHPPLYESRHKHIHQALDTHAELLSAVD